MKKTIFNGAVLLSVLLCFALVLFAGCDTGSSGDADDTETPIETPTNDPTNDPSGDDPTDDPAAAPAPKLDFESANIATLVADSALYADVGDVRATWGDSTTDNSAVSDMVFSADTSEYVSGSASLKVTATALQNKYANPQTTAQWVFRIDLDKTGLGSPMDLTGKMVSLKALLPDGSTIQSVKLVFQHGGEQSQGKEVPVNKDDWTTVSYKFGDPTDYTTAGFDITNVELVKVVAIINGASANAPGQAVYFDSLTW